MATTPEGIVKASINALLDEYDIAYSMKTTMGYGKSGWPDYDVVLRGIYGTIEAKYDTAAKGPTALQRDTMKRIRESGGVTLVVDLATLPNLKRFLDTVMDISWTAITPDIVRAVAIACGIYYYGDVYAAK